MRPLVSIIVPTFDRPLLLERRSIPSVVRQSYSKWELIVVSDGPENDRACRAVESFGDHRLRYSEIERPDYSRLSDEQRWNTAGAGARNRGLELAHGEIIAALDDDDEFLPNHIEDCVTALTNGKTDFVYGFVLVRDPESGEDRPEDWLSWTAMGTREVFLQRNIIYHSSVAYSRRYAHLRYPTDGRVPADYALWLAINEQGARFSSLDWPQAIYHGDNLSTRVRVSVPSLPPAADVEASFARIRASRTLSNGGPSVLGRMSPPLLTKTGPSESCRGRSVVGGLGCSVDAMAV